MKKNTRMLSTLLLGFWYLFIIVLCCGGTTIFMVCKWAKSTFDVGLNAIMNTIFSPLKGTSSDTVIPAVKYCLPVVIAVLVLCIIYIVIDKRYRNKLIRIGMTIFSIGCVIASLSYVQLSYDVIGYLKTGNQDTEIYKELYVDPHKVEITAPKEARNLLLIYLESMETTYASKEEGGMQEVNYIPYLTQLAKENISFSNNEQLGGLFPLDGAAWTMGAIFASTSGLPFAFPIGNNGMEGEELFASGVYSLGDFLYEQGYTQEFLCGSKAEFAGRKTYYTQHRDYEIFDLYTAREKAYIPEDYYVWWGYEDTILYKIAKDELLRLSEEGEPFNLTMLTVDTHHIGGYQCNLCRNEYTDVTANVVSCADRQIAEFIEWCKKQDFYDNTTIVIIGDHPRMDTHLVDGVIYQDRTTYNCFINSLYEGDIHTTDREATAIDLFPTILASMGYSIEGEQLGLGINLFSDKATLTETIGLENLNNEFSKRSTYYVERFSPELSYLVEDEKTSICTINVCGNDCNASSYIIEGIGENEGSHAWTVGNKLSVCIPIEEPLKKVKITMHLISTLRLQFIDVVQNGEVVYSDSQNGYGNIEFEAYVENGECRFDVMLPNAMSPYELEESEDTRKLALKLTHITVNIVED